MGSLSTALAGTILFLRMWIGAMGWHLGRIAQFRPDYAGLADTPFTAISFIVVYATAAIVKYSWVAGLGNLDVALEVFLAFVLIAFLSIRREQSTGLFCALLGSSAIVDILGSGLALTGIAESVSSMEFKVIETCLYLNCVWEFTRAPAAARKAGYRRKGAP